MVCTVGTAQSVECASVARECPPQNVEILHPAPPSDRRHSGRKLNRCPRPLALIARRTRRHKVTQLVSPAECARHHVLDMPTAVQRQRRPAVVAAALRLGEHVAPPLRYRTPCLRRRSKLGNVFPQAALAAGGDALALPRQAVAGPDDPPSCGERIDLRIGHAEHSTARWLDHHEPNRVQPARDARDGRQDVPIRAEKAAEDRSM